MTAIISKTIYTIVGLSIEEKKEPLGLYLSDKEEARHWLSVRTDLYNRGVKDIVIDRMGELKGFHKADLPPKLVPKLK
jgi:transposase-like protein